MVDQTPGRATRIWLVELFAFANLAFLSIDVYLAHSLNDFANRLEWAPVPFGLISVLLIPALVAPRSNSARNLGYVAGWSSIALGLTGLFFHLHSAFFQQQTIKSLVYAAPFVAPLAYVGAGMLVLVNRMEGRHPTWGSWVLILAAGGFLGNFVLSLLDHAQNGFYNQAEWIPVAAGAFGTAFLLATIQRPADRQMLTWCGVVMALELVVGILGAGLHQASDWPAGNETWFDRIVFGAPVFAPLLFSNLALLASIGLWDLEAARGAQAMGGEGFVVDGDARPAM